MVTDAADIAENVGEVLSARDLASGFDPDELEVLLAGRLDAEVIHPGLWDDMPPEDQQMVIGQLRAEGSQLGVARVVEECMAVMSKPEFERMLRGIFEEDELTLIIIGGVLGGAVGLLQGALVAA